MYTPIWALHMRLYMERYRINTINLDIEGKNVHCKLKNHGSLFYCPPLRLYDFSEYSKIMKSSQKGGTTETGTLEYVYVCVCVCVLWRCGSEK